MGGVKREGTRIEESVICDEVFEGIVSVRIVSETSVAESVIRDRFLSSCNFLCVFPI